MIRAPYSAPSARGAARGEMFPPKLPVQRVNYQQSYPGIDLVPIATSFLRHIAPTPIGGPSLFPLRLLLHSTTCPLASSKVMIAVEVNPNRETRR